MLQIETLAKIQKNFQFLHTKNASETLDYVFLR